MRLKQGDDVEELSLKIAAGPKIDGADRTRRAADRRSAAGCRSRWSRRQSGRGGPRRSGRFQSQCPAPRRAACAASRQPAAATPRTNSNVSVSELLAERRRAARAAAEAAAAGSSPVTAGPPR